MQPRQRFVVGGIWSLAIAAWVGCGGGTISPPAAPTPDFGLLVSPASITVVEGDAPSAPITVSVTGRNGFSGSVTITLAGLPESTTTTPGSGFTVTAGSSQDMTLTVPTTVPLGTVSITLRGASGALAHSVPLTLVIEPQVRTFQEGSRLVLEAQGGNETTRVGLESQWGGTMVEASVNGINPVNHYDAGREVQVALYDSNERYDNCAGCTGVFGWNPVQGGDKYGHGSPLLDQTLYTDSIYVRAQPLQWNPDDKGGGPSEPVPGDASFEQTLSVVPGHARTFRLHYRLTHFGNDQHGNVGHEFPAVYVNSGYDRLVFYGGTAPWTNAPVTVGALPTHPDPSPHFYTSEKWVALVDGEDFGLTVWVPQQYPYFEGFNLAGTPGETGFGSNYFHPHTPFTVGPDSILEGDIYLLVGDYKQARQSIYKLRSTVSSDDILAPFGWVDAPGAGSVASGTINVYGWTLDDTAVAHIEVFLDGALAGSASYGQSRPDVATDWPHAAVNVGFQFSLDTARYANGSHTLVVKVRDSSGNVAVFRGVSFTIDN